MGKVPPPPDDMIRAAHLVFTARGRIPGHIQMIAAERMKAGSAFPPRPIMNHEDRRSIQPKTIAMMKRIKPLVDQGVGPTQIHRDHMPDVSFSTVKRLCRELHKLEGLGGG